MSVEARKAQIEEDNKHLLWLFELQVELVKLYMEKDYHPVDAATNASAPIEAYLHARLGV